MSDDYKLHEAGVEETLTKIVTRVQCVGVSIMMPPAMMDEYSKDTGLDTSGIEELDLFSAHFQLMRADTQEPFTVEVLMLMDTLRQVITDGVVWLEKQHAAGKCECGEHG